MPGFQKESERYAAIKKSRAFSLEKFTTWPLLHEFEVAPPGYGGGSVLGKPGGFILIHEEELDGSVSEHPPFFLEVDRGGKLQDILIAKVGRYLEYYRAADSPKNRAHPAANTSNTPSGCSWCSKVPNAGTTPPGGFCSTTRPYWPICLFPDATVFSISAWSKARYRLRKRGTSTFTAPSFICKLDPGME
jgi:hypothetical protein